MAKYFMGTTPEALGIQIYEAENGFTYLYDSNWNWIGSGVYYHVVMSNGTIYTYGPNWQWIRTVSGDGGRGGGGEGGRSGVGGWGAGGWRGGPGFGPGSYSGPGFGFGFWSIGPQPKQPIPY